MYIYELPTPKGVGFAGDTQRTIRYALNATGGFRPPLLPILNEEDSGVPCMFFLASKFVVFRQASNFFTEDTNPTSIFPQTINLYI